MENQLNTYRSALFVLILVTIGGVAFAAGLAWSIRTAQAAPPGEGQSVNHSGAKSHNVIYPKKTDLDFEGLDIQGEVRNPAEFYFQHRPEEKFNSLVQRRKDFHREMLRDAVLSK